jgi:hypothetical protein
MDNVNPYAAPRMEMPAEHAPVVPATLFGALATGTSLFLSRFPTFAAITLAVWGPLELFQSYCNYFIFDAEDLGASFRLSLILEWLFGIIVAGGVTAIGAAQLEGERLSWWTGVVRGLGAWPRLFGTRFIAGIILALAALLLVLPALYLGVRFAVAEPVAIVERRVGMAAIKRSLALTHGAFFRYLGICLCTIGPFLVLNVATGIPGTLVPELNHWLFDAALMSVLDLAITWTTLVILAAYMGSVIAEQRANEDAEETDNGCLGQSDAMSFAEKQHGERPSEAFPRRHQPIRLAARAGCAESICGCRDRRLARW